ALLALDPDERTDEQGGPEVTNRPEVEFVVHDLFRRCRGVRSSLPLGGTGVVVSRRPAERGRRCSAGSAERLALRAEHPVRRPSLPPHRPRRSALPAARTTAPRTG